MISRLNNCTEKIIENNNCHFQVGSLVTANLSWQLALVMVAAQCTRPRTRLDQQRRAAQRGKFQQFCSAVPRSVKEDETTSLH